MSFDLKSPPPALLFCPPPPSTDLIAERLQVPQTNQERERDTDISIGQLQSLHLQMRESGGGHLRSSVTDLTGRIGSGLVVDLVVILEQLLLVNVLVASLVLQERSGLREERAVVVARAVALCKSDKLAHVKTTVATTLMLVVVAVLVVVAKVVVVVTLLLLLVVVVVVQEALGHVANLVEVEAGHFVNMRVTLETKRRKCADGLKERRKGGERVEADLYSFQLPTLPLKKLFWKQHLTK